MFCNIICVFLAFVCSPVLATAAYTVLDGKLVNKEEIPTQSVQEHYSAMLDAAERKDWKALLQQSTIVNNHFSNTAFASEAIFYLGVAYFHIEEYEVANEYFSDYLKRQAPKYFEEAIQYKFSIAEKFQKGAKKHLLGYEKLPKWMPAQEEAIVIYDEVITALPHHDLAAHALFNKAHLQVQDEDYRLGIETYQTLIRRFPKHVLAAESYIGIGEVYLTQCKNEYPDPDFLDLAEINLRKFREAFPSEEKIALAEENLYQMREIYAKNLFETARFFERTNKARAAIIYYKKIVSSYPNTTTAEKSLKRLLILEPKQREINAGSQTIEKQNDQFDSETDRS